MATKFGYVRVAAAVPHMRVANCVYNANEIKKCDGVLGIAADLVRFDKKYYGILILDFVDSKEVILCQK